MKRDKRKKRLIIYGCNHRFNPSKETEKECDTCNITPDDNECKDDIVVGERCYMYKVVYY
ncbi:MAG: hypothetical protein QUS12_09765 [Methanosarcina sp.]|nr:hypothetical protein [Methanosarcina sp.]